MSFSLSEVMDAMAKTIRDAGLADNVYPYSPPSRVPPCVVINYPGPNEILFNQSFKHGMYKATFTVDFVVGNVIGLEARDALSDIIDGAASVAQVLELTEGTDLAALVDTVAVSDAGIVQLPTTEGLEQLAARFVVEVGGR